eukprot:COSAG06_NODE_28038_length_581_cov_30.008299_1_plen_111_part_00
MSLQLTARLQASAAWSRPVATATKGLWVALDPEGVAVDTTVLPEATVVEVAAQMAKARAASASAKALSHSKMRLLCRECPTLCYQRAQVVMAASTTTQELRPGVGEEEAL